MKATAELKMLPVSVLKPAAYNPRKKLKQGDKEYEKIKNSITEFGFADPLVVNADMTIIGGHQRLTVAMELGYTEVPCAVVDIDKTREKALNIALNKITGAWDDSLLADLLKDIEDSNFDLGKTGFEPPEIETLFNKVHSKEVKEDDFDVESELKQPCFSKEGDLWHLGKHIVLCGDSTKAECYDTLMDGTKANLVLSDPPYNVDVEETAGKIMNDNMGDSEFYQFLLAAFQQMHGHLADDGSIYIFHADTEGLNFKVKITKDNLKFLLDLLDEAERISYDRCKAESPGIEVEKSLGCAIWMHAFEVGYFRIVRDGVGQSVCFTDLTKEERTALLADKDEQFLRNLCCYLADRIQELGDIIEEQSRQLLMDDLAIGRTSGEENGWIPAEDVRKHFAERI